MPVYNNIPQQNQMAGLNTMPMQNTIGQQVNPNFNQQNVWPTQQPVQQPQGPRMIVDWVDGEAGMLAYPLGVDMVAYLFDKTSPDRFWLKMTDRSGMPVAPRKFHYGEDIDEPKKEDQPITREEFNNLFSMVSAIKEAL